MSNYKLRTKVIKGAEVRFISHLDFMNTLTRALRRAEIPIAFSQGYNPRPQISFASALAVSLTSESEYIDFELTKDLDPAEFRIRLNQELPTGIRVEKAMKVPVKIDSLMSIINAGSYIVRLEFKEKLTTEELEEKVRQFLEKDEIKIIRKRRNKSDRELDLRPMIFSLEVVGVQGEIGTISMLVQTGSAGNVRPQEVIRALAKEFEVIQRPRMINIHRSGLYIKKRDDLFTPFEV
ncbi:TIGR03936 family radical SAM-associated protein [Halanaerobacter jeridensis]|uniref:Radical SAM-linked protein n=1 Tax=Halanaerobacter jeridensis TaxID=706427 RepID=A0A939BRN3_9FIRM|nr:TIGR03936 family radical SAM-associated protein [Halanaerobacter jeridensis]MBM7556191.1 radical SAM-linked protein [Halanaerobacter jeridensis]